MQKNIFLIVLLICTTTSGFAQKSLNRFMHKYARRSNADYVNIGRLPMMLARPFIDDKDENTRFLKKIHKVEVLDVDLNNKEQGVHHDIAQLKSDLTKDGYDELMFIKSDGDRVHILGKTENDNIVKDCVLLVDNDNEISVVHVEGEINLDEVGNLSGKWGNAKFSVTKN